MTDDDSPTLSIETLVGKPMAGFQIVRASAVYEVDGNDRQQGGFEKVYRNSHLAEVYAKHNRPTNRRHQFRTKPVWVLTNEEVEFVVSPDGTPVLDERKETVQLRKAVAGELTEAERAILGVRK